MQQTLLGELKEKYYCIHCPWIGFDVAYHSTVGHKLEACPKCGWACYDKDTGRRLTNLYPVLERKVHTYTHKYT